MSAILELLGLEPPGDMIRTNPQSYPFWGSFWRGIDVTISKNIPYGHQCPWLHMLHIYLGII